MQLIKEYKYNLICMTLLAGIILALPIMYKGIFPIVMGDTQAHLNVFNAIINGNVQFLYFGQITTGYLIKWLNAITNVSIPILFIWFSYISLLIGGIITMLMVNKITKSNLAGILSAFFITFGTGAIIHLFNSGTIFSIIEMIILLPLTLITILNFANKHNVINGILLILSIGLLLIWHPTFGIQTAGSLSNGFNPITNPINNTLTGTDREGYQNPLFTIFVMIGFPQFTAFVISLWLIIKNKIKLEARMIFTILFTIAIIFGTIAFSGRTAFSPRVAMNFAIVINMITCLLAGILLKNKYDKSKLFNPLIISLLVVGIMPNLVQWIERY